MGAEGSDGALAARLAGAPGVGGVNRGRADAELIWGAETPGATDRFEAKTLPDARFADLESTAILGIGAASPREAPVAEGSGPAGAVGAASSKTAWQRRLAPRHRGAVKSFFSRE